MVSLKLTRRYLFFVGYPALSDVYVLVTFQENEPSCEKKGMSSLTQNTGSGLISEDNGVYDWREFLCGWGAAFINISITYPINKLIFRQVRNSSCHHTSCVSFYINP